jgi:hypothetical protein
MPIGLHREAKTAGGFDEKEFMELYRTRAAEFHMAWTVFFVRHMSALYRQFGNLEDGLLLAAIGIGPMAEKLKAFRATGEAHHLTYGGTVEEPSVTNAVRLSEITGIPRQTVRRKLQAFAKQGWVEQLPDRQWRLARRPDKSAAVAADLSKANREMVQELAQLMGRFDRLMRMK